MYIDNKNRTKAEHYRLLLIMSSDVAYQPYVVVRRHSATDERPHRKKQQNRSPMNWITIQGRVTGLHWVTYTPRP